MTLIKEFYNLGQKDFGENYLQEALEKVEGVHFVEVTYKTKLATVKFENTVTSIDDLISVTTNAGFPSTLKSEASND